MSSTGNSSNVSSDSTTSESALSIVEPSHPLYLYPLDSPGTVIVASIFNGLGYGSWRQGMLIALSCKNKIGLINGTVAKPSTNLPLYEAWYWCNDMVTAWILNSLDLEIR